MGIVKYLGIKKNLGGVEYVIPPISLGALQQLQKSINTFTDGVIDEASITTTINVLHASLKRNYPEMTAEQVADMVDVGNMFELFEVVMDVSGLKRKEIELAEQSGEAVPNQV